MTRLKPLVLLASIALFVGAIALCVANSTPWWSVMALPSAFGLAYAMEEECSKNENT